MFTTPPPLDEIDALKWAMVAMQHYPTGLIAQACMIAHSENLTYYVTDPLRDQDYLLRLHYPAHDYLRGVRQMSLAIQSELHWLEALAAETGLPLQQPIRTRDGELLAQVDLSVLSSAPNPGLVPATLLTWLAGEPFHLADPAAPALAADLGRLLARLHNQAQGWTPPPAFTRPHYETAYLDHIARELLNGLYGGLISEADYLACEHSLAALSGDLAGLGKDRAHWGLIHNDLHPGNCLVVDGQVLPIDFSLSGFGYYLFDIGTTLGSLPPAFRPAVLDGYREHRPLAVDSLRLVEGSLIASRLSYYAFILHDPAQRDWLRGRIAKTAAELCRPFLAGEGFLMKVR